MASKSQGCSSVPSTFEDLAFSAMNLDQLSGCQQSVVKSVALCGFLRAGEGSCIMSGQCS